MIYNVKSEDNVLTRDSLETLLCLGLGWRVLTSLPTSILGWLIQIEQAVSVATRYAPAPLFPLPLAPRAPPSRRNVVSHAQYVLTVTAAPASRVKAAVSKAVWWSWPLTFDPESGVRVACDVGYVCANFGLIGLSVLDLGPMYATDVRQTDRQTSDKSIA